MSARAATTDVDVLIVGAGLSGIGAAATLTRKRPGTTYRILESRDTLGGTWDLFRYPGVRSDSDMYTLGFSFKPWRGDTSITDGAAILDYLRETAEEYGVLPHIRYGERVVRADFDTAAAVWTVTTETADGPRTHTARFLWACSGYYDYEDPYDAQLPGIERFEGRVVHPQFWPEDLDYAGKRVVVIGSGATAVTLVPAMAEGGAAKVTMLQRSPTYVISVPARDALAVKLQDWLPTRLADEAVRWKAIGFSSTLYQVARRRPELTKRLLRKGVVASVGEDFDVDTHFTPRYDPWDQRLCLVPDADLFKALRRGTAEIVTDTIETFEPGGIRLASGDLLEADIVVTATGLRLKTFGGAELSVDGEVVDQRTRMAYRALMLSEVPNLIFTIGYTNASWTLKADLVASYFCRLLDHLDAHGQRTFVVHRDDSVGERPFMDFTPGYVLRALDTLPVQGDREPWRLRQNYVVDRWSLGRARLDDGVLEFA